ncbi:restriction endonuclease subunit S [Salinibaculum salinum]|uniref:restriction endonuclease subunit S n=1 Tax=Salinibaculum salinum TaxID=3131996 RepID=UPI0030EEB3E8
MADSEVTTLDDYESDQKLGYDEYSEFKEFDEEWINRIPAHWEAKRFRSQLGYTKGAKPKEVNSEKTEKFDIPYLSMEYLRGQESSPSYAKNTDDLVLADSEDILLLWDGSKAGEFVQAKEGAVSSTMAKLFQREENDSSFLYYELKVLEDYLQHNTVGMGIPHVNPNILKNIRLIIPPDEEQKAIAEFLDEETERVDKLVEHKKTLLELLDEKRNSLITNKITKGLDEVKETKDSDIPGVGEIPESWDLAPLKFSSQNITVGIVQKPSQYYVDDGVPALRAVNIEPNKIVDDDFVRISEEYNNELKGSQVHAGDLVSVRRGDPGTTAVIPEELDGANCINLVIIRQPDGYIPEFLSLLMNSEASKSQVEAGTTGATMAHFNVGDVQELVFPKPDLEEQREILDWLSPRLEDINVLEEKIQEGIEHLEEYRTALITAAVTGQIDVRGEV